MRVVVPLVHPLPLDALSGAFFVLSAMFATWLALRRPVFGVCAMLLGEPFDLSRSLGPTTVSLPKALLVGFVVALVVRRTSLAPLRSPLLRPLLGGAIAIAAVTAATFVPASFYDPVARETFKALEYAAIFCATVVALRGEDDERFVWLALGASAVLVCCLAIFQLFTISPSGFNLGTAVVPRIAGPLDGPNQLAGWLACVVPVLAARAMLDRSRLFGALAVLGLITSVLTYSRAGVLGVTAGTLCVVAIAVRRKIGGLARLGAVVAVTLLLVAVMPLIAVSRQSTAGTALTNIGAVSMRLSGTDEERGENGLEDRDTLWRSALTMFARSPVLGVGAGNFEFLTPTTGLTGVRTHANSLYLQSLAEGGIALLAAVLWTIAAALVLCLRPRRSTLVLGAGAGTIALATHQLFDTIVFYPKIGDMWWLLLGIAAACVVRAEQPA